MDIEKESKIWLLVLLDHELGNFVNSNCIAVPENENPNFVDWFKRIMMLVTFMTACTLQLKVAFCPMSTLSRNLQFKFMRFIRLFNLLETTQCLG